MVQENPRATTQSGEFLRRMRAHISDWDLKAWLASLAALTAILAFPLKFFSGDDNSSVPPVVSLERAPGGQHMAVLSDSAYFLAYSMSLAQSMIVSLEEAGGLFDSSVLQSRQRLELLADQVETVTEDLDDAEYESLRVLAGKLNELSESLPVTPDDVDDAWADVSKVIGDLSAVRAYPIVLGYTPLFVIAGGGSDDAVRVEVTGFSLTSGDPSLTIGNDRDNNRCDRSRPATDGVLAFLCGGNLFPEGDAFQTGILRVYREPGFFERLLGSGPVEYSYSISIRVVPDVMGRATLSVTRQQAERQSKSQGFSDRNAHCADPYERLFQFNASNGWEIDQSSIDVTCLDVSSMSTCNEHPRDVTGRSFYHSCMIANAGKCVPFGIVRDGRGSCRGVVHWEEVRDVDLPGEELEVELRWGREERIELPEGTRSVQGAIVGIDGIHRTFGSTIDITDSWFDVDVNLEDRYVVIRSAELDAAMWQGTPGAE